MARFISTETDASLRHWGANCYRLQTTGAALRYLLALVLAVWQAELTFIPN